MLSCENESPPPVEPRELTLSELCAAELHYGDIFEMLTRLGFRGSTSKKTFNDYLKSLRKLNLPVVASEAPRRGHIILYSYENVMDLVVGLTLRVYYVIPDTVLKALVATRSELHPIYRQAYAQRRSGAGAPLRLGQDGAGFEIAGIFLELNIDHSGGKLVQFGPPEVLTPLEAVEVFARSGQAARAFLPIHISALAQRVAAFCQECECKSHRLYSSNRRAIYEPRS